MTFVFIQNIILSLIVTGITFTVVFLLNYLNKKKSITTEVSRKVVHIGAGTLYLALYFYNDQGYISKYLNIFPNLLWTCILIWKSQQYSSTSQKYDPIVGAMTRTQRQHELLRGPLFFNFAAILCGTIWYKTVLGSIIMGILTWGDGLAAVVGVHYGNQRRIYGTKTFPGLLACFLAGIIASIVYTSFLVNFQSVYILKMFVISLITAIVETVTPSDFDNLTIPLSVIVIYYFIY